MDIIHLTNLRAYGHSGALPEETRLGQWFQVDLQLHMDLQIASQTDRLADTLDYGTVATLTQTLIRQRRFDLIEAMAGAIVTAIFDLDPRLARITVRVTKPTPPIPDFTGQVAVEITRDRMS